MNSVSLRRINTSHKMSDTDTSKYPVDVDHYWLKVGISSRGLDRSTGNASGLPELFFRETKSGGSYDQQYVQVGTPYGPRQHKILRSTLLDLIFLLYFLMEQIYQVQNENI